jgi:hypothetical protein
VDLHLLTAEGIRETLRRCGRSGEGGGRARGVSFCALGERYARLTYSRACTRDVREHLLWVDTCDLFG